MSKNEVIRELAKRIRNARHVANITQMELAERMDCHLNCIGRIERGQVNPSLTTIIKIANALGVKAHELLPEVELKGSHDLLYRKYRER